MGVIQFCSRRVFILVRIVVVFMVRQADQSLLVISFVFGPFFKFIHFIIGVCNVLDLYAEISRDA